MTRHKPTSCKDCFANCETLSGEGLEANETNGLHGALWLRKSVLARPDLTLQEAMLRVAGCQIVRAEKKSDTAWEERRCRSGHMPESGSIPIGR